MKSHVKILFAFLLNLFFSIFEFIGGILTGSVSIASDAVHDLGDALSIGISFFLERKSKKRPDSKHTYGYARYSALGSVITTVILITGSVFVIYNAILKILSPTTINYDGMIIFAIVGTVVNFFAALFTHGKGSLNQKAVNLHMLEDVLGWLIVLIGALVMKFTNFALLDPILSIALAIFIFINAFSTLKQAFDIFLEKAPKSINVEEIKKHLLAIENVIDVHHIHIWSMDGENAFATLHVVAKENSATLKKKIKNELLEHGVIHSTIEFESEDETCEEKECEIKPIEAGCHHHHHGHGHGHHSHNHSHNHCSCSHKHEHEKQKHCHDEHEHCNCKHAHPHNHE